MKAETHLRPKGPGDPGLLVVLLGTLTASAALPALTDPVPRIADARADPESERRDASAELLCRRPLARVNAGDSERWPLVDVPVSPVSPGHGSGRGMAAVCARQGLSASGVYVRLPQLAAAVDHAIHNGQEPHRSSLPGCGRRACGCAAHLFAIVLASPAATRPPRQGRTRPSGTQRGWSGQLGWKSP